jgi:hypothetical protein
MPSLEIASFVKEILVNERSNPSNDISEVSIGGANAEVWELIQALVLGHTPPDRILELFYWSQDQCALEMARAAFVMPPESRTKLRAFLAVARPQLITVKIELSGQLILSSPDIADGAAIERAARDDAP